VLAGSRDIGQIDRLRLTGSTADWLNHLPEQVEHRAAVSGGTLRVGLPVVDMVTGFNAVIGVLLALQERQRSGRGQFVKAALYDSGLSLLHPHAAHWFMNGEVSKRTGNAHPNIHPYDTLRTRTDPIFVAVGNDRQFASLRDCR
jgi:crotonobetainyl-CoA:carnitine CoA-transferase CaiB-like acyl-CoA transferase